MSVSPGSKIGPYEILFRLAEGGMGEVYRAKDTRLSREVAIKILPPDLATNSERLSRFNQEARSASALNHPNIITVYDVGSENSTSYLAMEFVDGKTLREILREGPLPIRKIIAIAVQIADGISKAHSAGIIHRDLKPENIMISKDGLLKILDFGLAKVAPSFGNQHSQFETQTGAGILLGTVCYMSPEQVTGSILNFHSDQFSFGSILYEMLTGKRAFVKATAVETLTMIMNENPVPITSLNPQAPAAIRWIAERCLAKDPEDRYASTRDLAHDLHSIRDHIAEITTSTGSILTSAQAPAVPQKTRFLIAGLLTGILIGALAVALYFMKNLTTEPASVHYLTFSGHDRSPAASPDGKAIAFASDRDGRSRIWLKQLSGRGEVVLTAGPDSYPRFSPDGSMILFIRNEGQWSSLFRVSILGGEPRKLIQDVNSADWSPDGQRIAFVQIKNQNGDLSSSIGIANSDGTRVHQISYFKNLQVQHPRWSPDGKMIVVRSIPFGQVTTPLFVMSADGKDKREISPPRRLGWFSAAAWSSPHTLIFTEPVSIVAARSSTSGRLIEQDINTNKIKTLFWSLTLGNTLDIVSPGRLVLDAITSRENLHEVELSSKGPAQHNQWLTKGVSTDRQPAYSPDGKWVLFSSNRSGNLDLWIISTTTGVIKQVTDDDAEDWDPAFMPDGNILWSSSRGGHFEIWTAAPDGSNPRRITSDGADAENPTATPDGKWIVYASYNPSKLGIWKIRSDGSQATQILSGDSDLPETSRDGNHVLYRDERADPSAFIRVVRLADKKRVPFEVKVRYTSRHEDLTVGSGGRARWMPDGKSIAFLDRNQDGIQGIYVQDFNPDSNITTERRIFAGFDSDAPTESFGISPDGLHITIAGLEAYSSLMIIDGIAGVSPPPR